MESFLKIQDKIYIECPLSIMTNIKKNDCIKCEKIIKNRDIIIKSKEFPIKIDKIKLLLSDNNYYHGDGYYKKILNKKYFIPHNVGGLWIRTNSHIFPINSAISGIWNNGILEGECYIRTNNFFFKGMCIDGKINGVGNITFENDMIEYVEGVWVNNYLSSNIEATIRYKDNLVYLGFVKNFLKHGKGILISNDKKLFVDGNWDNDLLHLKNIIKFGNNTIISDWLYGQLIGDCIIKFDDQTCYEGKCDNIFRPNIYGKMKYPDGSIYIGEWKNGYQSGFGKMIYDNGSIYDGEWKDGKRNGFGKMIYYDGSIYVGQWKDCKRSGYGFLKCSNKNYYQGQWDNDKKNGIGRYFTYLGSHVHEYYWKDNVALQLISFYYY